MVCYTIHILCSQCGTNAPVAVVDMSQTPLSQPVITRACWMPPAGPKLLTNNADLQAAKS